MTSVAPDETVYMDYKEANRQHACSAKLKTTDIQAWTDIHTDWYKDDEVETSEHAGVTWEFCPPPP